MNVGGEAPGLAHMVRTDADLDTMLVCSCP